MSFNYLPTPLFIGFALCSAILLFSYSSKLFFQQNDKLGAIGFSLLGSIGLGAIIIRVINQYFESFKYIIGIVDIILGAFTFVGFSIIAVLAWKRTKADPGRRNILYFSFGAISIGVILIMIVILKFEK